MCIPDRLRASQGWHFMRRAACMLLERRQARRPQLSCEAVDCPAAAPLCAPLSQIWSAAHSNGSRSCVGGGMDRGPVRLSCMGSPLQRVPQLASALPGPADAAGWAGGRNFCRLHASSRRQERAARAAHWARQRHRCRHPPPSGGAGEGRAAPLRRPGDRWQPDGRDPAPRWQRAALQGPGLLPSGAGGQRGSPSGDPHHGCCLPRRWAATRADARLPAALLRRRLQARARRPPAPADLDRIAVCWFGKAAISDRQRCSPGLHGAKHIGGGGLFALRTSSHLDDH